MSESRVSVTWESLESYIAAYAGRTKIQRLLHIADRFEPLRIPAYRLALETLSAETLDTTTYEETVKKLQVADPLAQVDGVWLKEASKRAIGTTDKLEQELKSYKNNLIKESMRMGQQDVAFHYAKMGDLTGALRALVRNRDYCTTPLHTFQVNMAIVGMAIQLGQWNQVQSYVAKIENMPAQVKERTAAQDRLHVASALALLSMEKYKEAADRFLQVDAALGNEYNTVVTMNDVANFTSLLALATFSRTEILRLIESSSFKPFSELEVASREALGAFYKSRYAECFKLLDSIRGNMEADIFFAPHVAKIYALIRERSLLQYTGAFTAVSLERMSTVFSMSTLEVQEALATMIVEDKLRETRIDLRKGLVVHETEPLRQSVYHKAFESSDRYAIEVERSLFHLAVAKAGLQVESAVVPTRTPQQSARYHAAVSDTRLSSTVDDSDGDMMDVA